MSIFKKAEEKKLLTVLEAYQQAFGGVPDDARCFYALEADSFYGEIKPFANIVTDKGHFFWDYDKWVPVMKLGTRTSRWTLEKFPDYIPHYDSFCNNKSAQILKGKLERAPQIDRLFEKTEKGISNMSDYLKLFDGENY
jgi:hypothetical protein